MSMDNTNLIEFTGKTYGRDNRISSNRLKLKDLSFKNISSKWKKFFKESLENRLAEEKKKLVDSEYQASTTGEGLSPEAQKAIEKSASKIAKLEAIIMILSKENVPNKYKKRRAIKLKQAMFSHLIKNSVEAYVLREQDKSKVLEVQKESTAPKTVSSVPIYLNNDYYKYNNYNAEQKPEQIDVQNVSRDDISSAINNALKEVPAAVEEEQADLNKDAMIAAIDSQYGKIYKTSDEVSENEESVVISEPTEENVVTVENHENNSTPPVTEQTEPVELVEEPTIHAEEKFAVTEEVPVESKEVFKEEETKEIPIKNELVAEVKNNSEDKTDDSVEKYEFNEDDTDLDENSILSDLEELSMAHDDYQKSEEENDEINKMIKQQEDEAQKISQERVQTLNRVKEMKERVRIARDEYIKLTQQNMASKTNKLENYNKLKSFNGTQRSAINGYNAQIEKMQSLLDSFTINKMDKTVKEEVNNTIKSEEESKQTSTSKETPKYENWHSAPPTKYDSALAESSVSSYELDEAYRIINDVENSTLTELRWARDIIDLADQYTRPDTISAEQVGSLDNQGVMHAPTSAYGMQASNSPLLNNAVERKR